MANGNGGRIDFDVNMNVNKNSLNDLIKPLQQVQKELNSMSADDMTQGFKKAAGAAQELESIINSSWNDKLNQLNLDKFNQSVKTSYGGVSELREVLSGAGASGDAAFNSLASSILNTNLQLRESNKLLDSMATSMANTVKWGITSSIFNNITGSIQKAYYYAKDLDTSLNDIRIVTGDSADQMQRFAKTANDAAKDLGRSTLDYTKAALGFYQQGLSDQEVETRTNVTLKAQNITGGGTQMVDQLTAVWNGYNVATEDTQGIVDKLAKVADSSASNMSELATAMSKVAATANTMGVDVDKLTAQLATVIATTRQAPESVGTAFKTIYSRLNDIKTGADDAQISLGNYSGKMAELGFNVLDANGELRNTGQVIEQIGSRWDTLSKAQQIYLAETMGGVRQVTQVVALFDNWTKYSDLLNTSLSAQGTLNQKNDIYLQSTAAHLEQLGAEAERTYAALFDMDIVNTFVDGLNGVLTIFNDFIEGIGGGANAFIAFGTTVANIFSTQIGNAISAQIKNFELYKSQASADEIKSKIIQQVQNAHAAKGESIGANAAKEQAEYAQRILDIRKGLTQEEYNGLTAIQQKIGLAQQQIDYINSYKQDLKDIGINQTASLNYLERRLSSQKEILDIYRNGKVALQELFYLSQQIKNEDGQHKKSQEQINAEIEKQKQNIIELLQSTNLLDDNQIAETWEKIVNVTKQGKLTQEEIKKILDDQGIALKDQQNIVNKLTAAVGKRRMAEDGTLRAKEQEKQADKAIFEQQQKQHQKQLEIQQAVRMTTGLLSALSTGLGGLNTFMDSTATASEKVNGAWAGMTGAIAGVASAINPMYGMIVTGASSAIKSILQLAGAWDWFEDRIKTLKERSQELRDDLSKVGQIEKTDTSKIGGLEEIQEEWESLYQKYNEDRDNMTEEQIARYHELTNQFSSYNESVIAGYDEQGNAIVANQDALSDTIQLLKDQKQAALQAAYATNGSGQEKLRTADEMLLSEFDEEAAQKKLDNLNNNWQDYLEKTYDQMGNSYENALSQFTRSLGERTGTAYDQVFSKETSVFSDLFTKIATDQRSDFYDQIKENMGEIPKTLDQFLVGVGNVLGKIDSLDPSQASNLLEVLEAFKNASQYQEILSQPQASGLLSQFEYLEGLLNDLVDYNKEIEKAEKLLDEAKLNKQKVEELKVEFTNVGLLRQTLKYDTGSNEQYKNLLSLDSVNENFVNQAIDDFVNGWRLTLDEKLANSEDKIATSYQQIIQFAQQYERGLYEALSQSQGIIEEAFSSLNPEKAKTMTSKQYSNYLESIVKGAIDQINISKMSDQAKASLQRYLAFIFDLDSVDLDEKEITTKGEALAEKNIQTLTDAIVKHGFDDNYINDSPLSDWIENLSEKQLASLSKVIDSLDYEELLNETGRRVVPFSQVLQEALLGGLEEIDTEEFKGKIEANIEEIASMAASLQSGKFVSTQQKNQLAQALGLDPETLSNLQDDADWLAQLLQYIKSLEEGSFSKLEALRTLFPTINTLQNALDKGLISKTQYNSLLPEILNTQMESLKLDITALGQYAHAKGMAFDTTEDQARALLVYKQGKGFEQLGNAVSKAKDQVIDYNKHAANFDQSYDAIKSIQQAWEQLTGEHVGTDYICDNIEAIAAACDKSFNSVEQFVDFVTNFTAGDTAEALTQQYDQGKLRATQGQSAKQALSSGKALTGEQSYALAELQEVDNKLAEIAEKQGINSQAYIDELEVAIEKQRTLNEEARQGALERIQAQILNLQQLQKNYDANVQREASLQRQLQTGQQITQEQYQQALATQEKYQKQNLGFTAELEHADAIVATYEHRQQLETQLIQVQEDIANGQGDINQLKAEQLRLMQQINAQSQQQIDNMQTIDELQSAKLMGKISDQDFEKNLDAVAGRQAKSLGLDEDQVLAYADALQAAADEADYLADSLETDRDAALEVAIANKRLTRGLASLSKNFEQYQKQLTSDNLEEFSQALVKVREDIGDILNIDGSMLSADFFQSAQNLEYMAQAARGDVQAIDALRAAAATDIIQHCDVYLNGDDQVRARLDNLNLQIQEFAAQDIEIGASIDDTNFINACNQMIADAKMTESQIQAYFNELGFDPKIDYVPAETKSTIDSGGNITLGPWQGPLGISLGAIEIPYKLGGTNVSTVMAPRITSLTKIGGGRASAPMTHAPSGGGGRGGGGKGGKGGGGKKPKSGGSGKKGTTEKPKDPKTQKALEDKQDRYHDINIELKHINDQLQKLQQAEKKATGKELIENLNKQLKVLNKQVDAQQTKLELQRQQRDQLKNSLAKQGVKFDVDGDITNYSTILSEKLKEANDIIAKYNAMSAEEQQEHQDMVDQAKQDYENLKEQIERYDELISEEMPQQDKKIRDLRDQMIEKQIQKFKINVDLQLDTSEAERDFNAFKKKVIDQISDEDILGNTLASFKDLSSYYKAGPDVIDALTNQVNGTLEQLLSIDRTGDSSVYGDKKAAALQDLKKYTDELMQNLEDIEDLIQDIKDSIFDAIDAAQDAFDTQVDEYEFISDILDHNIKMTELLYGDDAYETMSKYYSMQQQNNNKQLDFLRRQKDMWFSRMVQEQERMNELDVGSKAFKEAEKRFEEYKNHWMDAVDDLNSKLEDSLENIIDKYANAIDLAFDKLDKKLTDGKGLDYIGEEWELINKQADLYLDTVNSMYEIEKLGNAYEDAIKDNEGDLKAQKSLTSMMKEQLAYLKDKDKLTQYDVDRANALLQIELKRLALEQQRQNKTKLRLRRDSQGNYTYQYTVDKESVQGAEQELRDAEVSLYNMTKEAYKNNLDSYYDTVSDWQDRVKQVYKDTTLTVQEQQQKIAMLNEYYGGIINGYTEQNQELKLFLMKDTFDELSKSYGTNVENFQKMSDDQKEILMEQMIPYWDSGIQHMATTFAGQGGFLPTVAGTFGEIDAATRQYQMSLDELQEAAGVDFAGIAFAIDEAYQEALTLTDANQELIKSYDDQVTAIDKVIGQVQQLSRVYTTAKNAATAATEAAFEYWQQENKNSIAMAAKQKTNSTPAKKSSSSNSSNGKKSNSSSSSSGNKSNSSSSSSGSKSSSGSGSSGSSSGSGNKTSSSALQKAKTTASNYLSSVKKAAKYVGLAVGAGVLTGATGTNWLKRFDTGGYTGSWGGEGKLALLDQKELVLNSTDTENILQAVAIVKTMNDMLSGIKSDTSLSNANNSGNYNSSNGAIDQNVKIEAHFPNVKDHSEIEQALNNLVNQASQFAFKN